MANHSDTWLPKSRYPYATQQELAAGVRVDAVGHYLHEGDAMTCMCCGADAVVGAEHLTSRSEGFDYDGSQWVRTPLWVERLRRVPELPHCTCGAIAVTVGLTGLPQHAPDCALNQVTATNGVFGGGVAAR